MAVTSSILLRTIYLKHIQSAISTGFNQHVPRWTTYAKVGKAASANIFQSRLNVYLTLQNLPYVVGQTRDLQYHPYHSIIKAIEIYTHTLS
jgi:hypothetical protein